MDHVWSDVTVRKGASGSTWPQSARRSVTANLASIHRKHQDGLSFVGTVVL